MAAREAVTREAPAREAPARRAPAREAPERKPGARDRSARGPVGEAPQRRKPGRAAAPTKQRWVGRDAYPRGSSAAAAAAYAAEPASAPQPARSAQPARAAQPVRSAQPAPAPASRPGPGEGSGLRLVPARRRFAASRRRKATLVAALASAVGVAVVFGLVYLHVLAAQEQFRIDRLTNQAAAEAQTYESLRLELDRATSPAAVMAAAKALGMHEPSSVTYLQAPAAQRSLAARQLAAGAVPVAAASKPRTGSLAPLGAAEWPAVKAVVGGLVP